MSFQKILISTVILLAAACTPPEDSTTKGDPSATLPPTPVVAPFSSQRRLALVIGNSDYAGNSFLSNPVNDAEDFATALRELNFDVIHRSNLNQQQMETVINQFMEKLRNNNGVGLFYFSGHGVQHQGENYLIPVGASRVLRAADQLRYKAVAAGFVLASMKSAGNKTNLIILDACRNAPFKSGFKGDMIPPGLTTMPSAPGALIAYAASPGGVAMNGSGRNSPYVKHLIAWMKKPQLSLNQILRQVRRAVHQETNGIQSPGYYDELNDPFYFNPQATPPPPPPPPFNAESAQREKDRNQAERERLARQREAAQRAQAELEAKRASLAQQQEAQARLQAQAEARLAQQKAAIEQEKARWQAQAEARLAQEREAIEQEKARLQAVPDTHRLTVLATPADSRIRIMNINPRYVPGIALNPGRYDVLVEKRGYVASRQWITIQNQDITLPVVLAEQSNGIFRDSLQDGSQGPEMVWIPGGSFRMGDIQGGGDSDEQPVHSVSVRRFAMGRYEVTVGQFRQFVNATGYRTDAEKQGSCWTLGDEDGKNWRNLGFSQNDNHPVVCVSWNDATAYAAWLSQQTGQSYRLPTEAEWEYAARAGTTTKYWWGNNIGSNKALCDGCGSRWDNKSTAPVGSFAANPFGLYDTVGNVYEWTCSEFESKYAGKEQRCANGGSRFALRGGSWYNLPRNVRAAYRDVNSDDDRNDNVGFRLARSS